MRPSATRVDYLFLSHTDAFGEFRVGSHHLSRELAAEGHSVAHVTTPVSWMHLAARRGSRRKFALSVDGLLVDSYGVKHLTGRTPLPAGVASYSVIGALERLLGPVEVGVALVDQPLLWSNELIARCELVVYRPTDMYPSGLKRRWQQRALAQADAVVTTSGKVLAELGLTRDIPTLVLPNGVDTSLYPLPEDLPDEARPQVAAYVGALDDRFAWSDVEMLGERFPTWMFDLYGPGGHRPGLPENVRCHGPVDPSTVPSVLTGARVGLLPLSRDPVNAGRSPMKLYEYLASGLQVVVTATPVLRSDPEAGVWCYSVTDGPLAAFESAASAASPNLIGARVAQGHSWHEKACTLMRFLDYVRSEPRGVCP